MLIRHLAAATALALLAACGGGGSDAPTAQPQAEQAGPVVMRQVSGQANVHVYGDSIAVAEAVALKDLIAPHHVTSHAVGGKTLRWAIDTGLLAAAPGTDAHVVVLAYGTNDARMLAENYSPAQFGAALGRVARDLHSAGIALVIETPPQVLLDLAVSWRFNNLGADQYADAARAVARDVGAVLCDRNTRQSTPETMPDGVHPVGALVDENARALAECIKEAMRR